MFTKKSSSNLLKEAVLEYVKMDLAPVPVAHGEKGPKFSNWQNTKLTTTDAASYFEDPKGNVAIIMGELSGGLVDIDLDCPEAVRAAGELLPENITHRWSENEPIFTLPFQV